MGIHDLPARRLRQTLDELEGVEWGPPNFDSHLVQTCHRLRIKPIGEFTDADLRIMIGQDIGSKFLVPLALERLDTDPLLEANYEPGDLLSAVLELPSAFWRERSDLRSDLEHILSKIVEPEELLNCKIEAFKAGLDCI